MTTGKAYHEIEKRDGKYYKIVFLRRLPWDRLCNTIKWLRENRPGQYAILRDPHYQTLMKTFNGDMPIEFETKIR